ncbi:hypothetical protein [Symbiobacterium terraclitae]|uniref:hypothetical protein n=1 Tax=Symbiobacterium terraclitae TaxID=557451 RepID=UPI0035B56582
MSERWKLGWLESYNAYTGEPERFVYRPGDDEHTRICVRGENCDEDARRIVASVNACLGIPTETLEAGAVVVPIPECRHPKATLSAVGLMLLQQARAQEAVMSYDAATALRWAAKAIEAALSRLQQNGGADHDCQQMGGGSDRG